MIKIAPSILSADFMRLGSEIKAAETAGADMLHIDIMDGCFVPNITIGPAVVAAVRTITSLPLDVHLMIETPDRYLKDFADAGSDYITVHAEACIHLHRTVQAIKELGAKAGVSLNPATPLSSLDWVLPDLDMVLLMSVNPGFSGQGFIASTMDKLRALRKMMTDKGSAALVEVDGGVKLDNAGEIASAGADALVMGSAFFSVDDYGALMKQLREILKGL